MSITTPEELEKPQGLVAPAWGENWSELKAIAPDNIEYTTTQGDTFSLVKFTKEHALQFAKAALDDPDAGKYFDFADTIQKTFQDPNNPPTEESTWKALTESTMGNGGMHGLGLDYAILDAKGNFAGIRGFCPSYGTTESLPADTTNGVDFERPATLHNLDMHAYTLPEFRGKGLAAQSAAALALAIYPLLGDKQQDALLTMTISPENGSSLATARKLGLYADPRFEALSTGGEHELGYTLPFVELARSALARLVTVTRAKTSLLNKTESLGLPNKR